MENINDYYSKEEYIHKLVNQKISFDHQIYCLDIMSLKISVFIQLLAKFERKIDLNLQIQDGFNKNGVFNWTYIQDRKRSEIRKFNIFEKKRLRNEIIKLENKQEEIWEDVEKLSNGKENVIKHLANILNPLI